MLDIFAVVCVGVNGEHLRKQRPVYSTLVCESVVCLCIYINGCGRQLLHDKTAESLGSSGRLCEGKVSMTCDVMGLAQEYCLDQLKALCANNLKHPVDSENVCFVLKHADEYQVRHARNPRDHFIVNCGHVETQHTVGG